jgi:ribose transport system substrate-binding protein
MAIYGANIDPDLLELMKDGNVSALDGGHYVEGSIVSALLMNYLDGHQILDPDGNIPILDNLQIVIVTAENADIYDKYWIQ